MQEKFTDSPSATRNVDGSPAAAQEVDRRPNGGMES